MKLQNDFSVYQKGPRTYWVVREYATYTNDDGQSITVWKDYAGPLGSLPAAIDKARELQTELDTKHKRAQTFADGPVRPKGE